jgi:hypothetical protein
MGSLMEGFFLVKQVLVGGLELIEPNKAVLCLLIVIILISYYFILLLSYKLWRTIPAETRTELVFSGRLVLVLVRVNYFR